MVTADLLRACHELFGVPFDEAAGVLEALDLPSLKRAYRRAAHATHPDRFGHMAEEARRAKVEAFIRVGRAYQALRAFLTPESAAAQAPSESGCAPARPNRRRGPLPDRPLQLGEFLVYSGILPVEVVRDAVGWQRRAAPCLGQIATGWGWLDASQIETALGRRRTGERVGTTLLRHGLLTPFKLRVLLRHQDKVRPRLGSYFTARGLLSPERLQRYLSLQAAHNACHWQRRAPTPAPPRVVSAREKW